MFVFLCFFFFKQKTAYEMRISDWSSDVCSSDLIIEEPEAHLHPQLQAVLLDYLGTIKAVEGEKPVQLFVTSHSPNFASIADLDSLACLVDTEIGRASCRERVCQYV